MEPLTYLMTPEGPAVAIGTGDDSVEVGLVTSAKLDGKALLCKTCVRELPVAQGGIRLMTCPYCKSSRNVIKSTVYAEMRSFALDKVQQAPVRRWAVSSTRYQELSAPDNVFEIDSSVQTGTLKYVPKGFQVAVIIGDTIHEYNLCRRVAFGEIGDLLVEVYNDTEPCRFPESMPNVIAMFPKSLQ